MIVYHGSTIAVTQPDVKHSLRPLDFGPGFYVTTVKEQAERWARRKSDILMQKNSIVNVYEIADYTTGLNHKTFAPDLSEWLDFVCRCRNGEPVYSAYDIISGMVADDKVFRVVDMYNMGIWDKERTLSEIKVYPSYNQTSFVTQKAIDTLLKYQTHYTL